MKKLYTLYIFFLFLFLFSNSLTAQQFQWAKQIGGDYWQSVQSIDVDSEGNVYLLGVTENQTTDLDPGTGIYNLTHSSSFNNNYDADLFLIKLDSDGNFVWGKGLANAYTNSNQARKIKVGPDGNVYTVIAVQEYPLYKQIIHKHDASGNLLYTKELYDLNGENAFGFEAYGLDIDSFGNTYVSGYFYNDVFLDPNNTQFNLSYTGTGSFIIKLNNQGEIVWVKAFTDNQESTGPKKVLLRPDGNLNFLVTRYVQNENQTGWDPIQTLYNINTESAEILWQKEFEKQYPLDFTIAPDGSIVVLANFQAGSFDVDPGENEYILTSELYENRYILWLSQEGEFVNVIPYYFDWGGAKFNSISFDENSNFYLTGSFENEITVDLNPDITEEFLMSCEYALKYPLIIKFDSNKVFETAYKLGSGGNLAIAEIIPFDDMLYLGGRFTAGADFDPGPGEFIMDSTTNGVQYLDGYILKLGAATLGVNEYTMKMGTIIAYPNPAAETITVKLDQATDKKDLKIIDITGKEVYNYLIDSELNINISNLEPGIYFIRIEGVNSSQKFIKY